MNPCSCVEKTKTRSKTMKKTVQQSRPTVGLDAFLDSMADTFDVPREKLQRLFHVQLPRQLNSDRLARRASRTSTVR